MTEKEKFELFVRRCINAGFYETPMGGGFFVISMKNVLDCLVRGFGLTTEEVAGWANKEMEAREAAEELA